MAQGELSHGKETTLCSVRTDSEPVDARLVLGVDVRVAPQKMNDQAIRYLYRLLNHGKFFSRVHCQDPKVKGPAGALCSTLVQGEEAVVAWAREWNGKGQLYISRNPLLEWNKPGHFTALTFDIDPVYDKSLGASPEQVKWAVRTGQRILQKYPGGYLATSGNGILLLYTIPQTINLNGALASAYKKLNKEIKDEFEPGSNCHVDILADDMRLIRLIGTLNVKGSEANHRLSRFISLPQPEHITAPQLFTRLATLAETPKEKVEVPDVAFEPWVLTTLEGGWEENTRHRNIIRLAGYFGGKHIPLELAQRLILEANSKTPNSPYMDADVCSKVQDIYQRIKQGVYRSDEPVVEAPSTFEVGSFTDDPDSYLNDLVHRAQFTSPEIPWPFETPNKLTWGFPRGALVVLGAWTGNGKTSIAMTAAEYITRMGKSVLYFPTEMSQKEIKDRYISIATGIPNIHLFNGQVMNNPSEKKMLEAFMPMFVKRSFFMPKTDMPRLTPAELRKALDLCNPDFLIVDFLQRLGARAADRRREVGEFIMSVKDEIQKRKIACLVLSQFHRPHRSQNGRFYPPTKFDFAECGDIENTSDIAIILHPPLDPKGYVVETGQMERFKPVWFNVVKNRHGGTTGLTQLVVDTMTTRYSQI